MKKWPIFNCIDFFFLSRYSLFTPRHDAACDEIRLIKRHEELGRSCNRARGSASPREGWSWTAATRKNIHVAQRRAACSVISIPANRHTLCAPVWCLGWSKHANVYLLLCVQFINMGDVAKLAHTHTHTLAELLCTVSCTPGWTRVAKIVRQFGACWVFSYGLV